MSLDCCAKATLVVINILFQFIGFLLFVIGLILRFGLSLIQSYLPIDISGFLDSLPSITDAVGLDSVTSSSVSADTLDVVGILNSIALVLILLGLFMLVVGTFGCGGACCTVKVMLIVYTVATLVVFLVELIVVALLYTGVFSDSIKGKLNSTITDTYSGIDDFSLEGITWNILMITLQCCGINDYKDFDYATKWDKHRNFTFDGYTAQYTMVTPVACCKTSGTFPSITPVDTNCTLEPKQNTSNWNAGCWIELSSTVNNQENIFIGVYTCILIFELACAALAICIMVRSKAKTSPA